MIEIFTAIALLCQVSPSMDRNHTRDMKNVDNYQLECQKYYIKCLNIPISVGDVDYKTHKALSNCILDR